MYVSMYILHAVQPQIIRLSTAQLDPSLCCVRLQSRYALTLEALMLCLLRTLHICEIMLR